MFSNSEYRELNCDFYVAISYNFVKVTFCGKSVIAAGEPNRSIHKKVPQSH